MSDHLQQPNLDSRWILSHRGAKNEIETQRPYAWMVEKERRPNGDIEDVTIIFLSNKECSFKCLMCDLWKNTTDYSVQPGAIPRQIEWVLEKLPATRHIKLYNSGSFFDKRAIPLADYDRIAELVQPFETVIVESHPNLIGEKCLDFRDKIRGQLEVAMGLETVQPEILARLNKQMTLEDFKRAVTFLRNNKINSRAFILLRPPFMTEAEGIYWAKKSIDFAFDCQMESCTVIPVRAGNGAMEELMKNGDFKTPDLTSLETVLAYGIAQKRGLVFADLWDLELFSDCSSCYPDRLERLNQMNLTQQFTGEIVCRDCSLS